MMMIISNTQQPVLLCALSVCPAAEWRVLQSSSPCRRFWRFVFSKQNIVDLCSYLLCIYSMCKHWLLTKITCVCLSGILVGQWCPSRKWTQRTRGHRKSGNNDHDSDKWLIVDVVIKIYAPIFNPLTLHNISTFFLFPFLRRMLTTTILMFLPAWMIAGYGDGDDVHV